MKKLYYEQASLPATRTIDSFDEDNVVTEVFRIRMFISMDIFQLFIDVIKVVSMGMVIRCLLMSPRLSALYVYKMFIDVIKVV